MMFAFMITIHIMMPNNQAHHFRIYSRERYGQIFCPDKAREATERYVDYVRHRLPLAGISAEATCSPYPSRFI
jgi:hypothetical protein